MLSHKSARLSQRLDIFARTSVNVYLENIGKQYAFVILTSGSESEYYTIPAKALTSSKTFYNFSGMTTTIQWHVFISCSYNRENETYNFLKRNVHFSLFFSPIKTKAFNHRLAGN